MRLKNESMGSPALSIHCQARCYLIFVAGVIPTQTSTRILGSLGGLPNHHLKAEMVVRYSFV